MHRKPPTERDTEVLADPVAVRLLARASELDAALSTAVSRTVGPAIPPMVEQAFLLRCLAPGEAAELVRPLLGLRTNSVAYSPVNAPRVLTVHATPEQLRQVRSVLDEHEVPGSAACARSPR